MCDRRIQPEAGEVAERLLVLADRQRDGGGSAPDRIVGLGIRHQLVEVALDEPRIDLGRAEFRLKQSVEQEAGVGVDRPDLDLVEDRRKLADRFRAIVAARDQLGDHRVVEGRDRIALLDTGLDAAVFAEVEMVERPDARQKALRRVLRIKPRLDRPAVDRQLVLLLRQLLARSPRAAAIRPGPAR